MRAVSSKVTCPLRPHLVAQQVNLQAGRQHQADLAPRQHLLLVRVRVRVRGRVRVRARVRVRDRVRARIRARVRGLGLGFRARV